MNSTLLAVTITLCIVALVGLFALIEALAGRHAWHRREETERARTTGILVGFAEKQHRYRHRRSLKTHYVTVYYPIVRFQVDGVAYKLESTDIVSREKYQEGQSVDVLYDPDDPTHFHLDRGDTQERSTRSTVIFALVWIACAVIGLLISTQMGTR